jgi:hypothetical protein
MFQQMVSNRVSDATSQPPGHVRLVTDFHLQHTHPLHVGSENQSQGTHAQAAVTDAF